jgi:site-specific DNA-methyltransferase (adenine-specific)
MKKNIIYFGDNLDVIRRHLKDQSIDLIYLDPPFKSNQDYGVVFKERGGGKSAAPAKAFGDTWRWDRAAAEAYDRVMEDGPEKVTKALGGLSTFLGENDMMAYIAMMAPRLLELRRVLKDTGSVYLHCDPTAGHYLKMLMDAVFGVSNFENEIVWCYKTGGATRRRFARKHDTILFYAKDGKKKPFNVQKEKSYMMHKYGFKKSDFQEDERGQHSRVIMKDWWEIPAVGSADRQRLGYPTQKPEALLERIIRASSNQGDIVLDPFCGCGTTLAVAHRLGRRWIGIDAARPAIAITRQRLDDLSEEISYKVVGEPEGSKA